MTNPNHSRHYQERPGSTYLRTLGAFTLLVCLCSGCAHPEQPMIIPSVPAHSLDPSLPTIITCQRGKPEWALPRHNKVVATIVCAGPDNKALQDVPNVAQDGSTAISPHRLVLYFSCPTKNGETPDPTIVTGHPPFDSDDPYFFSELEVSCVTGIPEYTQASRQ